MVLRLMIFSSNSGSKNIPEYMEVSVQIDVFKNYCIYWIILNISIKYQKTLHSNGENGHYFVAWLVYQIHTSTTIGATIIICIFSRQFSGFKITLLKLFRYRYFRIHICLDPGFDFNLVKYLFLKEISADFI